MASWDVPEHPAYSIFVTRMWDSNWYHRVADFGYPATLPLDSAGNVEQNSWAFFPLYPGMVRGLMELGLSWEIAAQLVSTLCAGAAMVMIYLAVMRAVGPDKRWLALGTVVLTAFFPSAAVLGTAYTESLALLLVASSLYLLLRRWYWAAAGVVLLLGLTRAVALPFALVVAVHLWTRWRAARDPEIDDPLPGRDIVSILFLGAASVVSGFLWQIIMGFAMGDFAAYFKTQEAWRSFGGLTPFKAWFTWADYLMGPLGYFVLIAVIALAVWAIIGKHARVVGPELRSWAGFYLLYLFAVVDPQSSLMRFLLLAFPLGTILIAISKSRAYLAAVAIAFALFQIVWVVWLWGLGESPSWPP